MQELASGWVIDTERGPDWLFVTLVEPSDIPGECAELAQGLWHLLEQHLTYRLILELDKLPLLRSSVIAQLVLLHKRIHKHGGLLRICGLSTECQETVRACRLESCLPLYANREDAMMIPRPNNPR